MTRLVAALLLAGTVPALAQDDSGAPEPSSAVVRLLEAPHLDDEQRRAVRLFHGMWEADDLSDAESRAFAARLTGAWADPAVVQAAV